MINDSPLDLKSGVDFTGLPSAEGADLNNGIELAVPQKDIDETQGVGFNLVTTDVALNLPAVPDPTINATYNKRQRYTWQRRPFAGAVNKGFTSYNWNADAPADPIYLQWVIQFVDNTAITNLANQALNTANNAVAQANNAGTVAATANNTANTANNNATNALNNAATALVAANASQASADAAQASAVAAQTVATTATTNNPSPRKWVKLSETQAKGTDAGTSLLGKNIRILNTVDYNGVSNPVTLDAVTGLVTISVTGYYYIEAEATCFDNNAHQHQLLIVNNADNTTLLTGFSITSDGSAIGTRSKVCGLLLLNANQVIRVDHYISHSKAGTGLGAAANIHPDAGGREVYSTLLLNYITLA